MNNPNQIKDNNQKSPRTPTLSHQRKVSTPMTPPQEFKKKKFKQYIFRNYKATNQPGIVLFLLKTISQEILENIIFEVFRKCYKGVIFPNFLYFNSEKKVIKFNDFTKYAESIIYFYITESDIDSYSEQIKQSEPLYSIIEEQKSNLSLFVLKESEYLDFLTGRYTINSIQQSYTQLQFFLEQCFQESWSYLEDFAQVSYQRRNRLAGVSDKLEQKKNEIQDLTKLMNNILNEFDEQEKQVRLLYKQMGFDDNFIQNSHVITSRYQQLYGQNQQQSMHQQHSSIQYSKTQSPNRKSQQAQNDIILNQIIESPKSDLRMEMFLPRCAKEV